MKTAIKISKRASGERRSRSQQRGVRARKLTLSQIEEISAHLHMNVQFYDWAGQPANGDVLETIERELKRVRFAP